MQIFDAHLHIIDSRFPLIPNQGFLPAAFDCAAYLRRMSSCRLVGGEVRRQGLADRFMGALSADHPAQAHQPQYCLAIPLGLFLDLAQGQGPQLIEYRSVDNLGQVESTKSIQVILDDNGPVVDYQIGAPKYRELVTDIWNITASTEITLLGTDSFSGTGNISYRVDLGAYQTYTGPFTLSDSGRHIIDFYAKDNLTNQGPQSSFSVFVVTSKPVVTPSISNPKFINGGTTFVGASTTVGISVNTRTGVFSQHYKLDTGGNMEYQDALAMGNLTAGVHSVTFWAVDNLGIRSDDQVDRFLSS